MAHMADTTDTPDILRQAPAGRVVLWSGEVATLAGVTPMTITRWAKAGKVVASTTTGGNRRFWPNDVIDLLNTLERPVPEWLAAVAAALGGMRPLELAEASLSDHGIAVAAVPVPGERVDLALLLQCECGWRESFGAVATLDSLSAAALAHLTEGAGP
jgi:hypothetical protein